MKEEQPLQMMRRISFYGCDSYGKRKELQLLLEKAGAVVQDYRFLFSEKRVVFWYTTQVAVSVFKARITESEYAMDAVFVTPI